MIPQNPFICRGCLHYRHAQGEDTCKSIGNPELATLYGKCRRFQPRLKADEPINRKDYEKRH